MTIEGRGLRISIGGMLLSHGQEDHLVTETINCCLLIRGGWWMNGQQRPTEKPLPSESAEKSRRPRLHLVTHTRAIAKKFSRPRPRNTEPHT